MVVFGYFSARPKSLFKIPIRNANLILRDRKGRRLVNTHADPAWITWSSLAVK